MECHEDPSWAVSCRMQQPIKLDRGLRLIRWLRSERRSHLAIELGLLDHQEMGNGFQKLGLP